MNKLADKLKENKILSNVLLITAIVLLFTGVFLYWGNLKCVNFCDEIYTYILSNSNSEFLTFQLEAGKWYEDGATRHIMSAEDGFQFDRVMINNKGDVHPPIYYFVVHFLSVLNAGSCSKWIGLAANWIFAVVSLVVLYVLMLKLTHKVWFSALMCLVYIFSPAVLSVNMVIRMYGMFSMWVLIYVLISYLIECNSKKWWLYPCLAATTFCGFLTQYYFSVFCVIFTAGYCLYKLIKKKWLDILAYVGSLVAAVCAATLFWRTWIRHMFSGYLGGQVLENAKGFSKIADSIKNGFIHLFTLLYGPLGLVMGIILLVAIIYMLYKKDVRVRYVIILIGTAALYSIAVVYLTPVHLLSYRYFYPVAVIAYIAQVLAVFYCGELICADKQFKCFGTNVAASYVIALCFIGLMAVYHFVRPMYDPYAVLFVDGDGSYQELADNLEENSEIPWIYFGYENSVMAQLIYESMRADKFIMVNYETPFIDEAYINSNCQFLLFAEEDSPYQFDSLEHAKEWFNGEISYEVLDRMNDLIIYKVTHVMN